MLKWGEYSYANGCNDDTGFYSDDTEYYPERREMPVMGRISYGNDNHDDVYIKIASLVNRVAYLERKIAGLEGVIERYGEKINDIEGYVDNLLRFARYS